MLDRLRGLSRRMAPPFDFRRSAAALERLVPDPIEEGRFILGDVDLRRVGHVLKPWRFLCNRENSPSSATFMSKFERGLALRPSDTLLSSSSAKLSSTGFLVRDFRKLGSSRLGLGRLFPDRRDEEGDLDVERENRSSQEEAREAGKNDTLEPSFVFSSSSSHSLSEPMADGGRGNDDTDSFTDGLGLGVMEMSTRPGLAGVTLIANLGGG